MTPVDPTVEVLKNLDHKDQDPGEVTREAVHEDDHILEEGPDRELDLQHSLVDLGLDPEEDHVQDLEDEGIAQILADTGAGAEQEVMVVCLLAEKFPLLEMPGLSHQNLFLR